MFGVVTVMCLLASVYLGIDVAHFLAAFVDNSGVPGGPLAYYQFHRDQAAYVTSPVIFALLPLIGDCFMTYRIFVVWNRELLSLVIPILFITAGLVAAGCAGRELYNIPSDVATGLLSPSAYAPMIAYFTLMLSTNIVTTRESVVPLPTSPSGLSTPFDRLWLHAPYKLRAAVLLLGRMLWHNRRMHRLFKAEDVYKSAHWQVMKTVLQSEALYSVAVVANLVLYALRSNAVYITFAALPPLVGISFTMIIARIGLSEVLDESTNNTGQAEALSSLRFDRQVVSGTSTLAADAGPIRILISQTVDGEDGSSMELSTLGNKVAEERLGGDDRDEGGVKSMKP
ncbi:hypothetical protein FKP32DRAFT_1761336 [Trametes sanguinea]|nr:hypothetical protein FKP32DRAFT_1761336 [Trametes sanguinea]